jgi:O-antigen ligase
LLILVGANLIVNFDLFSSRIEAVNRLEVASISQRAEQAGMATQIMKSFPVIGLGLGNYTAWLQQVLPGQPGFAYQPVHSLYLMAFSELGLVGFFLLVLLLIFILKNRIFEKNAWERAGFFAILYVMLIISVFDHYFWTSYSGILLFGLVLTLLIKSED